MPSFDLAAFAELQVASDLRSVLRNVPNTLSRSAPKSITATYNFDAGSVSYEFVERTTSTNNPSSDTK